MRELADDLADVPQRAALVPERARGRPDAARRGRLLLDGVRRLRGAAELLRRPRRARRRPPQGGVRPRRAADRRRAAVPVGVLPAVAVARRLAAGALPGARPAGAAAAAAHRRRRRAGARRGRDARRAQRCAPASGRPRSAGCRCCCSTPTSRRTTPTCAASPTGSTAATRTTASARRSWSASAACAPCARYCAITGHPQPEVFHTNEGHAGLPRPGADPRAAATGPGLSFDEALAAVRAGTVFTTHTPVPAGIDRFPVDLVRHYFRRERRCCPACPTDRVLALGAEDNPSMFNMAHMGLRLAQRANGVSKLHGAVSRGMFGGLWDGLRRRRGADRLGHQRRARPHLGGARGRRRCSASRTDPAARTRSSDERAVGRCATRCARGWSTRCAAGCARRGCSAARRCRSWAGPTTSSTRTCSPSGSPAGCRPTSGSR